MTAFRLGAAWVGVAAFMVLGLLVALGGHIRFSGYVMGFGLIAAAMMRAAVPERYVSDIKVRSRGLDVVGYALLGGVVIVASSIVKLHI